MAPIPSTTGTIRQTGDYVFNTADDPVDITFDCGSDTDRLLIVSVQWDGASGHVLPDGNVLYNSVAMTAMGATVSDGSARKRSYYLVAPATGSNTLRVDPTSGAGDEDVVIEAYCYSGVDQATPVDGYTTANGLDASAPYESAVTITSASGDLGWFSHGGRGTGATDGTATGFTERLDNVSANIIAVSGDVAGDTSLVTSVAFAGVAASINWIAHGININAASGGAATAAVTGTLATGTKTQADVVEGGQTIILTLTGDTFVAAGATFDAVRDDIIAGLDAASSPSTGWNTIVRDTLAVTTVVRTSNTVCTITLPAFPTYAVTADEVITCTLPAAALTLAGAVVAAPTITIHEGVVLSVYTGTTNGSGVLTTDLTSDQASVRTLTTATVNGIVVGRTTTLPA